MPLLVRTTPSFPFFSMPTPAGGAVEVCLVADLGPGTGSKLFESVLARQRRHAAYVDELDEPSAKLHGTDFEKGEVSAVYSFGVGAAGHPFHRHAGHRVFTAVSGSSGAQLRFSTASVEALQANASTIFESLHIVLVPPDCMFTVRFPGHTWHQFLPRVPGPHPAFFALSCHTNELGGDLTAELKQKVLANAADIPSLTQLLPTDVQALLAQTPLEQIPTTVLSLDAAPGSLLERGCSALRLELGRLCAAWARVRPPKGYVSADLHPPRAKIVAGTLPPDSLLCSQLAGRRAHHEDHFTLVLQAHDLADGAAPASKLLGQLLGGFLEHQPAGVGRLMRVRNVLVRPLRLRTSALGCPVSSLGGPCEPGRLFENRFPVLDQAISADEMRAEVILGADDRHLAFRTCVGVRRLPGDTVELSLSTKVSCANVFGLAYMASISRTHRRYVTPALLTHAVSALHHRN